MVKFNWNLVIFDHFQNKSTFLMKGVIYGLQLYLNKSKRMKVKRQTPWNRMLKMHQHWRLKCIPRKSVSRQLCIYNINFYTFDQIVFVQGIIIVQGMINKLEFFYNKTNMFIHEQLSSFYILWKLHFQFN